MMSSTNPVKAFIVSVILVLSAVTSGAADRYSVATGNWNATSTWSAVSGGAPGASFPVAGDNVFIENGHTITVTANANCNSITFTGINASLAVTSGFTLTVAGTITLLNQSTLSSACSISGGGTLSCANIQLGSTLNTPVGNNDIFTHALTSNIAILNISGNILINSYYATFKTAGNGIFNFQSGTMTVGGTITITNESNKNASIFSMTSGAGTGLLLLPGANPFSIPAQGSAVELNSPSSKVIYNNNGAQTVYRTTYNDLTYTGSGAKNVVNGAGAVLVQGVLSMEGTATATGKAITYGAAATLHYKGSATQSTGTELPVAFNGSGGIIIENINGVVLNSSTTISTLLTFVDGLVTTGVNILSLSSAATLSGAGTGKYVYGNLQKGIGAGTVSKSFEIGDASSYTPVLLEFSGTTNGAGSILSFTTPGDHPNIGTSLINPAQSVNRYWTLTNNGVTGFTGYDATFTFVPADLDPGTDYSALATGNWDLAAWTYPSGGTSTPTTAQATGLISFGDFQLGVILAIFRSAATGIWEQATTWEVFNGVSWIPAPAPPSAGSGTITILTPNIVTVTLPLTVNELTVDAGSELVLNAGVTLDDDTGTDMTVNGVLRCTSTNVVSGDGSFLLAPLATLEIGSPDGISLSGPTGSIQSLTRSFDQGANYIYSASAPQVTGDGLPPVVNDLTVNNLSGVALSATTTINGTLSLEEGEFDAGTNDLIFQNSDIPLSRTLGSLTVSGTNISFGTAGNTAGAAFTIPDDLFTIDPVILDLSVNRVNSLTLGNQVVSVSGILLCNGPLLTNGNLLLLSDASGTGLVDGSSTGSISGLVTMQRYLPSGFGYRYISSPFQASTVNELADDTDLGAAFPSLYRYDESRLSSGWVSYVNPAGILNPAEGYATNFGPVSAPKTFDVSGSVNDGPLSTTLYNNNNTYTKGFNLVGNPYPSPIDWDAVSGWTRTNIDDAIYLFRPGATDQYGGTYSSYVNGIPSDGLTNSIIPSMQGFFIHVSDGAYPVTGTFGMDNSVRITDRTHPYAKSGGKSYVPLIRLDVFFSDDTAAKDPVVIYFDLKGTAGFDGRTDALKLLNTDLKVPNVYVVDPGGKKMSIDALPDDPGNPVTVPLGVKLNRAGTLVFRLRDVDPSLSGMNILLSDLATGNDQDLQPDREYSISMLNGEYNDRFILNITSVTTTIPEKEYNDELFDISSHGGVLKVNFISLPGQDGTISMYSLTGQLLFRKKISEPGYHEFFPGVVSGMYIVNYSSGDRMSSKKLIISSR